MMNKGYIPHLEGTRYATGTDTRNATYSPREVLAEKLTWNNFSDRLNPGRCLEDYSRIGECHTRIQLSVYLANHNPGLRREECYAHTRLIVSLNVGFVNAAWQDINGLKGIKERNGILVWLIPPRVVHALNFSERTEIIDIHMNDSFLAEVAQNTSFRAMSDLMLLPPAGDSFLIDLAQTIREDSAYSAPESLVTRAYLVLAANHIIKYYKKTFNTSTLSKDGLGPTRQKNVVRYIREHLGNQLSLKELANIINISPKYFSYLFRETVGTTPHKFVLQQRIEAAKKLIRESRVTLADVASLCGFRSHSHFSMAFRHHTGITPTEYRRTNRG